MSLTFVFTPGFADPPNGIEIRANPIDGFDTRDPSRRRFGSLEFRGGLALSSSYKLFGGISALDVQPDGEHFIALSDRGIWLHGRIVYDGDRPSGIEDAEMAPVLDADGKAPGYLDTESITENSGVLYVGIERPNNILRFDYGKEGFLAPGRPVAVPDEVKKLPFNQGLEAMVFVPEGRPLGGTLIAISEHGLNELGDIKAFLIGGPGPGMFTVKRTNGYNPSDAALLPDGDLLLLERQYSLLSGVAVRIRRLLMSEIKPGAVVEGPVVFEADMHCQIDNMEALSVHRASSGEIVITMMSDNNFSSIQRTLLLQFALVAK